MNENLYLLYYRINLKNIQEIIKIIKGTCSSIDFSNLMSIRMSKVQILLIPFMFCLFYDSFYSYFSIK